MNKSDEVAEQKSNKNERPITPLRKTSRKILFQMLFAKNFGENEIQEQNYNELLHIILEEMKLKETDVDTQYIRNSFDEIVPNMNEYKQMVYSHLTGHKQLQIKDVDLIILVLAIYELKKGELDPKIVFDTAIKLAKEYSNSSSIKFINGVLGALVKQDHE